MFSVEVETGGGTGGVMKHTVSSLGMGSDS